MQEKHFIGLSRTSRLLVLYNLNAIINKLGENTYHCHLAYRWVACWRNEKGKMIVEVEYVGSREKAPY